MDDKRVIFLLLLSALGQDRFLTSKMPNHLASLLTCDKIGNQTIALKLHPRIQVQYCEAHLLI